MAPPFLVVYYAGKQVNHTWQAVLTLRPELMDLFCKRLRCAVACSCGLRLQTTAQAVLTLKAQAASLICCTVPCRAMLCRGMLCCAVLYCYSSMSRAYPVGSPRIRCAERGYWNPGLQVGKCVPAGGERAAGGAADGIDRGAL